MLIRSKPPARPGMGRRMKGLMALGGALAVMGLCAASFAFGIISYRGRYLHEWYYRYGGAANRVKAWLDAPKVPTIAIDMKFKHYEKIRAKRDEALKRGILFTSDSDAVPATMRAGEKTFKVAMRLKGDWTDHLQGDKWSYRINVDGDERFLGMRSFSIQHPRTRVYDGEWAFHEHLRREGVLAPRYLFVRVVFNGEDKGIYALEEHFSKELLESQKRRESVIVKLDETGLWERRAAIGERRHDDPWRLRPESHSAETPAVFQEGKVEKSEGLCAQRDAAFRLLRGFLDEHLAASQVFKVPELARFLAAAEVWHSVHTMEWLNLRFYYDPIEGRLEPIGFDGNLPETVEPRLCAMMEPWVRQALRDPVLAAAYVGELSRMASEEYAGELRDALAKDWSGVMETLHLEWPGWDSKVWGVFRAKQAHIRRILALNEIVLAYATPATSATPATAAPAAGSQRQAVVEVGNVLRLPVELVGFKIGEGELSPPTPGDPSPVILPAREEYDPILYRAFSVDIPAAPGTDVFIACRIVGAAEVRLNRASRIKFEIPAEGPRPAAPPLAELLKKHPFLAKTSSPRALRVRKGDWTVDGDVLLPDGFSLEAGPGATLRFSEGAILLASGGGLDFKGTIEEPVRLAPAGDSWGGVVVLNAPSSRWECVEVSRTKGVDRMGWATTGGVTFYRSPASFNACRFIEGLGEDTVNIVRGEVSFTSCEFASTASDALDCDFAAARLEGCSFRDVAADAMDVSGSDVRADKILVRGAGDKGISAGENSRVFVTALVVERAKMGVASKDLSRVEASEVTIRDAKIGLAAYIKKLEYGPASITASGVRLERVETKGLCQNESQIIIDGERITPREVDVKALYAGDAKKSN